MFCVYGKKLSDSERVISNKLENSSSSLSKSLVGLNAVDRQVEITKAIHDHLVSSKSKKYSHELSAPEFAEEMKSLIEKTGEYVDLKVMAKRVENNKTTWIIHQ